MVFTGLEGIVVGVFDKYAIVHTRGFGRVLIAVADASKMQLGDWCTLEADRNVSDHFKHVFKWASTCPYACVKMPTTIPPILPTRLTQNKKGASYVVVSSPILVGTVKKKMAIGWSPQVGRINISAERAGITASFTTGNSFEGVVASVSAEENSNGCCQWALKTIRNPNVNGADWSGVREVHAVYHCFRDGLCLLKADDGSLISFGIADFVEEHVTRELVVTYHTFTVWVGPALASGDPVRAFFVKPSDEVEQVKQLTGSQSAPETSSLPEQSVQITPPAPTLLAPIKLSHEQSDEECKGKQLIKRLLADKHAFDTLYATDKPLLHELIATAFSD
uniref:Uncharacterized protein n=1 Tax=Plectus sambesii TaxID=2011161 RepID=A0A914WJU9_9BILA